MKLWKKSNLSSKNTDHTFPSPQYSIIDIFLCFWTLKKAGKISHCNYKAIGLIFLITFDFFVEFIIYWFYFPFCVFLSSLYCLYFSLLSYHIQNNLNTILSPSKICVNMSFHFLKTIFLNTNSLYVYIYKTNSIHSFETKNKKKKNWNPKKHLQPKKLSIYVQTILFLAFSLLLFSLDLFYMYTRYIYKEKTDYFIFNNNS